MNENKTITLGAIPSPLDYRDEVAATAMAESLASVSLPASFHTDLGAVLNQNIEPACVAHMAVEILKLYWFKQTGEWIDFSPRFLDTLAKRFDGQPRATGGTYCRLILQLLVDYGCATTATVTNDTSLPILAYRDDTILTPAVFVEAAKYKVPGYFAVPKDKQSTRASIFLYGAIGAAMEIGPEWYTPSWLDKDIDPLRIPSTVIGGHAITPNGWGDATLNNLRNHWSEQWANEGENRYDPIAWTPYTMEQWTIAEIPNDVLDFLKTLPSPANFHYQWNTNLVLGMEVVGGIDFSGKITNVGRYATDPLYTEAISTLYTAINASMLAPTADLLQAYISKIAPTSLVTAAMILIAAESADINPALLAAVLQHESVFGTLGAGSHTNNPGNVGNVDNGSTHTFPTWQAGVNACAHELARRQMPGGKDDVRFLQIAYMILGFLTPVSVAEFGIFGPKTATANAAYQKAKKIVPSAANVGPQTRAALNAEFAV